MLSWRRSAAGVAAVAAATILGGLLFQPNVAAERGCGWGKFTDERPPGECWRPFSAESPFNRALPASPQQPLDSVLMARTVTGWGAGLRFVVGNADTPFDFNHPIYFSERSNPAFRVNCTEFGGACSVDGHRVRIPNLARPAGGSDGHLAVIDQRNGWEYDFWQVSNKPGGGGQLDVGWAGRTKIGTDGATGRRVGATAAGFALSAGVIRPAELRAGEIDHALFMTVDCTNGHAVYPADRGAGTACQGGLLDGLTEVAPAMGQHFFLEMSNAEIEALPVGNWQKTILEAMARYGMFVGDTGGSGWGILIESASSFTSFGRPDPWVRIARRIGLPETVAADGTPRYAFDMRGTVDWASELRVAERA